jgi:GNAT superfamily N-acetyltransferase
MSINISVLSHLSDAQTEEVTQLAFAAAAVDEMAPLSEHVLIHLHHGGDDADEHLIASDETGKIIGYLHLDQTDVVAGSVVEVVVHPDFRRNGVGRALVESAMAKSNDPRMRLWAHGELTSAYTLAAKLGFTKEDFVYEPGQFAVRGGILDIYSFGNDKPYRIELFGNEVDSIRIIDPETQLSERKLLQVTIVPNVETNAITEEKVSLIKIGRILLSRQN